MNDIARQPEQLAATLRFEARSKPDPAVHLWHWRISGTVPPVRATRHLWGMNWTARGRNLSESRSNAGKQPPVAGI